MKKKLILTLLFFLLKNTAFSTNFKSEKDSLNKLNWKKKIISPECFLNLGISNERKWNDVVPVWGFDIFFKDSRLGLKYINEIGIDSRASFKNYYESVLLEYFTQFFLINYKLSKVNPNPFILSVGFSKEKDFTEWIEIKYYVLSINYWETGYIRPIYYDYIIIFSKQVKFINIGLKIPFPFSLIHHPIDNFGVRHYIIPSIDVHFKIKTYSAD
ncbi:MAG: hypothetical protein A3H98_07420 [Bacteroidetes bacterium RIFCSPLOWO2_02_FULL_36_8]|nr:MAG: hypothetical protein A3H98_07420 [Bacteroidetes bacterium RIFCSPLOWO2_02_FULL_36_8]OFY69897.1 MAG: hypothetical protein A3G23_05395 [Bacteroidetes bacterium RIFCSPLOWO2_12_FULL_37_12]